MDEAVVFLGYSAPWTAMVLDTIGHSVHATTILNQPCDLGHVVDRRLTFVQAQDWQSQPEDRLILGVGRAQTKVAVHSAFRSLIHASASFVTIKDLQCSVSEFARLDQGVVVQANCAVAPYAVLEEFVTLNRGSTVGHDTRIGRYTCINPGAHVAGECDIGKRVTIGMGALVFDRRKIGDGSIIGGGSVVTTDIPSGVVAIGSPARVIREIDS